jgi:hypothetical protein
MDQYCFKREELSKFLEVEFGLPESSDVQIEILLNEWEDWRLELVCLSTLLSQVLENKQKQSVDVYNILQDVFTLSERRGLFYVEEIDDIFIEYMLKSIRRDDVSIEDELVEIWRDLSEFKY